MKDSILKKIMCFLTLEEMIVSGKKRGTSLVCVGLWVTPWRSAIRFQEGIELPAPGHPILGAAHPMLGALSKSCSEMWGYHPKHQTATKQTHWLLLRFFWRKILRFANVGASSCSLPELCPKSFSFWAFCFLGLGSECLWQKKRMNDTAPAAKMRQTRTARWFRTKPSIQSLGTSIVARKSALTISQYIWKTRSAW